MRRIGEDANRGNDGWFYKVNDRAPEIGAGDPAARLRAGDRLLWFYCVFDEGARSCQRSLRILPVSGTAAGRRERDGAGLRQRRAFGAGRGGDRRGRAGEGGERSQRRCRPRGRRRPGRYRVTAAKAGMIDAFPVTVTVK